MLSILIPAYKQEINQFVKDLYSAAIKASIDFEIIIMDDGSGPGYSICTSTVLLKPNIQLITLERNIGRAAIRNKLAELAQYPNLLFLDADGQLTNTDFIINYQPYLNLSKVISGGRIYTEIPPPKESQLLHWEYGRRQESRSLSKRNKSPYLNFHSNNFLVPKKILQQYPFAKNITTYGYEDTLWARHLESLPIQIIHINNPVIHTGIEDRDIFLMKINSSIENLVRLSSSSAKLNLPLEKVYSNLRAFGLIPIFNYCFSIFKKAIVQHLVSTSTNLYLLQIYKLGLYSDGKNKNLDQASL